MTQDIIDKILISNKERIADLKFYSFLEKSVSADFYYNQFSKNITDKVVEVPDFSKVPNEMKDAMSFFKANLSKDAIIVELGGSRYQQRSGYPHYFFDNYLPLDISYTSIKAYVEKYDRFGIVADACVLPFKDNSIDAIFTHTFLEHPLRPDLVLSEINRVLKKGGYVVHSDAWHCRWWQRYGIVGVKTINEMSIKEKTIFILAKITESKIIRLPRIIFKRFISILLSFLNKKIKLKYSKLRPNYSLNLYKDEDAASSIDPVDVMLYYESNQYKSQPKLSFISKLFFKNLNIYLKKL